MQQYSLNNWLLLFFHVFWADKDNQELLLCSVSCIQYNLLSVLHYDNQTKHAPLFGLLRKQKTVQSCAVDRILLKHSSFGQYAASSKIMAHHANGRKQYLQSNRSYVYEHSARYNETLSWNKLNRAALSYGSRNFSLDLYVVFDWIVPIFI